MSRPRGGTIFVFIALGLADPLNAQQGSVTLLDRPCRATDTSYFGQTSLRDREGWYGKHLRAMREIPLCTRPDVESYRFLWLRTFHAPIAVRVQRDAGAFTLYAKVLSGAGGYDPGRLIRDTTLAITPAQWAQLQLLVEQAGFWAMMSPDSSYGNDGAQWVLEGATGNRYHVVDRWTPGYNGKESSYRTLCLYLVRLSGFTPDSVAIY